MMDYLEVAMELKNRGFGITTDYIGETELYTLSIIDNETDEVIYIRNCKTSYDDITIILNRYLNRLDQEIRIEKLNRILN